MTDSKTYIVVVMASCDLAQHTVYNHARNVEYARSPGEISSWTSQGGKIVRTNAPILAEEE